MKDVDVVFSVQKMNLHGYYYIDMYLEFDHKNVIPRIGEKIVYKSQTFQVVDVIYSVDGTQLWEIDVRVVPV